jgi:uncharacterized RDD family membrane protein YckC
VLTGMLRVFAEIGTQAEWLLIFLAVVVGVFVLVCALAAFVAIFTTNPDQRQIFYRIFHALLRFFHRRQDT